MPIVPKKFKNLDLSDLPTSNPGGGKPWLNNGALWVGPATIVTPTITDQPDDVTVVQGTTATFSLTATDATSYQWQVQQSGADAWSNVSGATSASYSKTGPTVADDNGDKYRCVVTGVGTSVTSNEVTLTVSNVNAFLSSTTGVYGAYGLSQMVAGYSGNAIRIKRDSDNAEQNFALVNGRVSSSAANSFIGSGGIGYIVKHFDQSGMGRDWEETDVTKCPVYSVENAPEGCEVWGTSGIANMNYTLNATLDGRNFAFALIEELNGPVHIGNIAFFGDGTGSTPQLNLWTEGGVQKLYHSAVGGASETRYPDSHKQLLSFRSNSTNFQFGSRLGRSTSTALPVGNLVGGQLGAGYAGTTNPHYGMVFGFVLWDAAPTNSVLDSIESAITTRYGALSFDKTWVFVGDSITSGFGSKSGRCYTKRLIDLQNDSSIRHCNAGGSGVTTTYIAANMTPYNQFYNGVYSQNRAFLLAGTNDLRIGTSPSTTIANLTSIVSSLKSTGYEVIQMTILPGSGVNETNRGTVNAAILAGTTGADIVVDIASDSRFSDSANFFDGLHPNDSGYAIMAELINAAI